MNNDNSEEFLRELRKLLEKYDGLISFSVSDDSDIWGIYDAKMIVHCGKNRKNIFEVQGWGIEASDL